MGRVRYQISKEWLEEHYSEQRLSLQQCADLIGCDDWTVLNRLREYDILRRDCHAPGRRSKGAKKYLDPIWMRYNYIDLQKTTADMAKEAGCCNYSILKWLRHHEIPVRVNGEAQRISLKSSECKRGSLNPMFGRNGSASPQYGKIHSSHGAWYHNPWTEKDIWLRSAWEKRVADYLFEHGIEWIYEPETFRMGEITYTPDFYLPNENKYIEVKGWMSPKAKAKIEAFNRWHPETCLEIWDSKKVTDLGILSKHDTKIKLEF
jgi:hypothetical protein